MTKQQREELEKLAARERGEGRLLTPAAVVEFARDEGTALHGFPGFLWDDDEAAAQAHRIGVARRLIRVCVRHVPQVQRVVRPFVSLPSDRATTGGYRDAEEVLGRPDWQAEVVNEVGARLRALRQSYSYLRALDPLFDRLDAAYAAFVAERGQQRPAG